jgi:endonuclease/exonuclease/phosphatase (EEP) superfamily protein YafD
MTVLQVPTPALPRSVVRCVLRAVRAEMKSRLSRAVWGLVLLCYAVAGFAWLWRDDFRQDGSMYVAVCWVVFMLRTFAFHLALLLIVLAGGIALLRRFRAALATLPLIALGVVPELHLLPQKPPASGAGQTLRVMTLNLYSRNRESAAILGEIAAAGPDVVVFQEYSAEQHARLAGPLSTRFPHSFHVSTSGFRGMAVYSQLAFGTPPEELPLDPLCGPQLRTTLLLDGRPVALYNIHMMLPRRGRAFAAQRRQFSGLLELLAAEKLPILLCGDFNATNRTTLGRALASRGLADAYDVAGSGRGATWPALGPLARLPGIRLDHVYVSPELTARTARVGAHVGSDHRPMIADVGFTSR